MLGDCLVTINGIGLIIQNWPDYSPSPTTFPSDPPPLSTPPFEFPPFDEDFGLGNFGDFAPIPGFDYPTVPPFPPPFPNNDDIFNVPEIFPKGDCGDLIPPFFDIDANNPFSSQTDEQLLKSKKSYEKLIQEHQKKLSDFLNNPDAFDNKGILKNARPEHRQKIIDGRANAIQKQLNKQQGELQKIQDVLQQRGID